MNLDRPLAQHPYDKLPAVPSFTVTSNDFTDGQPLAPQYAGAGENISPHLSWSGFPDETRSFLVSCFDPDAPTPAGWWHWTVVDLDSAVTELEQGAGQSDLMLPGAAFHVRHDGGGHDYFGPYPPEGDRPHRYVFAVHALDVDTLELDEDATATNAHFAAVFHTIARGIVAPTFQR
jgi:Raf kinase inhibitor-like YbhB/YbcL family protein